MKYRIGRKKKRVVLDENSLEIACFHPKFELLAQTVCDLLNAQLQQHGVMQAEGSDGAKGAAVASGAVEKGVRVDDEYTKGYKQGWADCCQDVKNYP